MAADTTDEVNAVRRHDRAQSDDWIEAFLQCAAVGYLATVCDGQPFMNSNLFVFDKKNRVIYLHTARAGRTPSNSGLEGRVAFAVAQAGRLLPAAEALEFSIEYASVVVFGRSNVVADPAEQRRALELLMAKYAPHLRPGRDYRPIIPAELKRTAVIRVGIDAWSGKQLSGPPDHPGAYALPDVPIPFLGLNPHITAS